MKLKKRLLTLLLSTTILVGLLSGCGGSKKDDKDKEMDTSNGDKVTQETDKAAGEESSTLEPMEISLAVWNVETAFSKGEEDEVLKTIQDKFNVKFKPVNITWDDYTSKIQLWAASDSLPDIFVGNIRTTSSFNTWATQGVLKEIPQDLSKYPTLEAYMNTPELATCQIGGKTYCIFRQTFGEQSATARNTSIAYRWDLAQAAGITKEPANWDEFRAMMQAIIEKDPDGTNIQGMTALGYDRLINMIMPYSLPLACTEGTSFYWSDKGDGTYVPSYFLGDNLGEEALPALQLLRDMYSEGTIEKDIALASQTLAHEKFLNGQSAAILVDGAGGAWDETGEYWEGIHGNDFFDDVKYLTIMPDVNGNPAYPITDYAWSESFINSSVDDKKLDRILQIYDYLLTDEGAFMGTYGMEGVTYDFNEEGAVVLKEGTLPSEVYPSTDVFSILVRWNPNTYDKRFPAGSIAPDACTEEDDKRQQLAKTFEIPEYDYKYTSTFTSLGSDFSLNIKDDLLTIATGTEPVADMWNKVIESYKVMGLEDVISKVNEAVK